MVAPGRDGPPGPSLSGPAPPVAVRPALGGPGRGPPPFRTGVGTGPSRSPRRLRRTIPTDPCDRPRRPAPRPRPGGPRPDDRDRRDPVRACPSRREALHLRLGRRARRGQCRDARPPRREGCRPGRDDERGSADPARIHDHHRGLQRLLRRRRDAPGRALGRRPRGGPGGGARDRQGLRRPGQPASRERPLRGQVLDARDDGHGPQPRPQRADPGGADRPHRQRAVRLGRLPALHPDVRPDRHGRRRRAVRRGPRRGQARPRRQPGHRSRRCGAPGGGRGLSGHRPRGHRPGLPVRPERPARPGHQGRLRQLVRQAGPRLPREPEDRPRPGHRRQRRDDGLRQHGRRLGHRRGLHPRPEHRREGPLRRVPHQRPGRGRGRRDPDAPGDRPPGGRPAGCLRGVPADRRSPRATLPRRPGPRVHDRARPPLHAPDAEREADRRGGREDRHRHGRRGRHHQGGGARPDRAGPRRPAPPRPVRPGGPQDRDPPGQGPERLARRRGGSGRLLRRRRRGLGGSRREGGPRPDRDLARRLPRDGRGPGDPHRPRRGDLPCRRRRPPDRQAVRRRLRGAGRRLRHQDRPEHRDGSQLRRGRLDQRRRLDRRGLRGCPAHGERPVRGPARAPDDPRLRRRGPPDGRLDERRQARGGRDGPALRRPGHRPVPDRAHVPRGGAARDRPRCHPGGHGRHPGQGPARRR